MRLSYWVEVLRRLRLHMELRLPNCEMISGQRDVRSEIASSLRLLVLPHVESQLDAVAQTLLVEDAADVPFYRSQAEV